MKNLIATSKSIALHLSDRREMYLLAGIVASMLVCCFGFAKGFIGAL